METEVSTRGRIARGGIERKETYKPGGHVRFCPIQPSHELAYVVRSLIILFLFVYSFKPLYACSLLILNKSNTIIYQHNKR